MNEQTPLKQCTIPDEAAFKRLVEGFARELANLYASAADLGDEKLLTRHQAAEFLGVSSRTIDAWIGVTNSRRRRRIADSPQSSKPSIPRSRERLPFIKLGHKVFFMLGDLRRFRDERKVA